MTDPEIISADDEPAAPDEETDAERYPAGPLPDEADEGDALEQTRSLPPDEDYPEDG